MNMLILMALAMGTAADRMAEVDRQQQLIWASSAGPDARAPALAALRGIGTTDDAAGMRAQALLLKWGSARDAQAAWQWLVTRHRDDKRLAPIVEGWWDGSALLDAPGQLQRLAAQTLAPEVRASAQLMLARRDLAEGRRMQGLAALRTLSRTAGSITSSLMGAGNPPRLANVAKAILFKEEALSPGAPLPAITAPTINGRKPNRDDWRGRPMVVDFWATWCPPCIAALPRLKRLSTANPQLRLVSVSGDDSPVIVEKWLKRKPHPGVHLWTGPSGQVSSEWVNSAYPFYVVVNRDGRIVGTATDVATVEKMVAQAIG